jgi:hypothetical protein
MFKIGKADGCPRCGLGGLNIGKIRLMMLQHSEKSSAYLHESILIIVLPILNVAAEALMMMMMKGPETKWKVFTSGASQHHSTLEGNGLILLHVTFNIISFPTP